MSTFLILCSFEIIVNEPIDIILDQLDSLISGIIVERLLVEKF